MAKDERPNERQEESEFLEGLKARTGRDLGEWMAAIASQGFSDKNEIIDWLRAQGLPFARASWLERIHRNGGRPIHAGAKPAAPVPDAGARAPAIETRAAPRLQAEERPPAAPSDRQQKNDVAAAAAELEKLLAAAKGYRPLYHHLEAEIRRAVERVTFAARGHYVAIGAPHEFAAVTLHPTEIRLGLNLGDRPFDAQVQKAKLRGPGPAITHMVVLTDARQVDARLLALIEVASRRANPTK
ncbi:MAG TPA: DUF5655 domain-containing protein [Hyphomicrobiaceae bacterium]|jgi:hypothetical protein|nr:DUF5655 domain-containing protein [Hyphomicrobiaceae bacterium]